MINPNFPFFVIRTLEDLATTFCLPLTLLVEAFGTWMSISSSVLVSASLESLQRNIFFLARVRRGPTIAQQLVVVGDGD